MDDNQSNLSDNQSNLSDNQSNLSDNHSHTDENEESPVEADYITLYCSMVKNDRLEAELKELKDELQLYNFLVEEQREEIKRIRAEIELLRSQRIS